MLSGVIIINKPVGPTSHDIVALVRRLVKTKVGHTGTLDPFASGVLLVTIGTATRLSEYTATLQKTYIADIILGATSDTDDRTGIITPRRLEKILDKNQLENTVKQFLGVSQQIPPAYAARKVNGKKLYEYARQGEAVERQATPIIIYDITVIAYDFPRATITLTCGSGTYVRALVRDLGDQLGVGAYVTELRRTAIGLFNIDAAVSPNNLTTANITDFIQPPEILVKHLPKFICSQEQVNNLKHGRSINLIQINLPNNQPIALYDNNRLIGIGKISDREKLLKPIKILG